MVDKDDLVVILAVTLAVALPTIFLFIGLACMRLQDSCDGISLSSVDQSRGIRSDESEGETHMRESGVTRSSTYSFQRTTSPDLSNPGFGLTFERWVRPIPRAAVINNGGHIGGSSANESPAVGLDQGTVDCYPIAAFGERVCEESGDNGSCPICLEKYCADDIVRRLPCTHPFHVECIDPWLRIKALCPLCKERLFRYNPSVS